MSFPEALQLNGYFTGYTGKGWGPGIATDSLGNDRLLTGRPYNDITCTPPTKQINAIDYSANFAQFLKEWDGGSDRYVSGTAHANLIANMNTAQAYGRGSL